jgi:hypothetical protein
MRQCRGEWLSCHDGEEIIDIEQGEAQMCEWYSNGRDVPVKDEMTGIETQVERAKIG